MSPATSETSEFYPPRASATPWWRRRLGRLEIKMGRFAGLLPPLRDCDMAAAASLLPGLGHLLVERRPRKAAALLAVYTALLLWVALFSNSGVWLGTALLFSYHQWLFTDSAARALSLAGRPARTRGEQLYFSIVCAAALGLFYHQAGRLLAGFGAALCLESERFEPLLARGDRLLIARRPSYRRGELVYSAAHGGLERLVGVPGDEILVENGGIFLNGRTLETGEAPFSTRILHSIGKARAVVPQGRYCVFFPAESRYMSGDSLLASFMIPERELDGKLALRYSPTFTRFP